MTPADLFDTYDNDRDGTISISEFFEFINQTGQTADKATVDQIFKVVDRACKGYVSKADLERALGDKEAVLDA